MNEIPERENTEPEIPETKETEQSPRNILTHYQETLDAMTEIEGEKWKARQEEEKWTHGRGLKDALVALEKYKPKGSAYSFIIYGEGGENRWIVRADGSVEFSGMHASHLAGKKVFGDKEKVISKALTLGFKIL